MINKNARFTDMVRRFTDMVRFTNCYRLKNNVSFIVFSQYSMLSILLQHVFFLYQNVIFYTFCITVGI